MIRRIVHIDEEKCDGCGQCIPACAEGAIALVGGKARLSSDALCDGLGACLGDCPRGAISFEVREAAAFDVSVATARLARSSGAGATARGRLAIVGGGTAAEDDAGGGLACPGARALSLPRRTLSAVPPAPAAPGAGRSRLGQWPVQLDLVPVSAPYFRGADLLVAADCVPFAYARFHEDFLAGRGVVIGCPKLDDLPAHVEKLGRILARNDVRSVTVVRMEVPCCAGITAAARRALASAGKAIPIAEVVIGVDGMRRG